MEDWEVMQPLSGIHNHMSYIYLDFQLCYVNKYIFQLNFFFHAKYREEALVIIGAVNIKYDISDTKQ